MSKFFIAGTEVIVTILPSSVPDKYLQQRGVVLKGSIKRVDVQFQDNEVWHFEKSMLRLHDSYRPKGIKRKK